MLTKPKYIEVNGEIKTLLVKPNMLLVKCTCVANLSLLSRNFLIVLALQAETARDANAKRQKRFAIVAVIVAIAVKINKKDLTYFRIH